MSAIDNLKQQLLTWAFSRFPSLAERWARKYRAVSFDDVPWTPMSKPVAQCRIAVITTAGIHLKSQPPFDMKDRDGDASYRELPRLLPPGEWTITHDYYDHADAERDANIVFPVDRLQELAAGGEVGELAPRHFSFMGHIDKQHIQTLLSRTAPEVAARLRQDAVDAVVLAPA